MGQPIPTKQGGQVRRGSHVPAGTPPPEVVGDPSTRLGTYLRRLREGYGYTLRKVEERATALVLYLFHKNLTEERIHPARALRRAQLWLRDASGEQLADGAEEMRGGAGDVDVPTGFRIWIKRQRTPARRNARPYNHPYYWSAFCHMGT